MDNKVQTDLTGQYPTLQAALETVPGKVFIRKIFKHVTQNGHNAGTSRWSVQFITGWKRPVAGRRSLVRMALGIAEVIPVTAIQTFSEVGIRKLYPEWSGEEVDFLREDATIITADAFHPNLGMDIVESFVQNPFNPNQDVVRNPSAQGTDGKPAPSLVFNPWEGGVTPYYRHAELTPETPVIQTIDQYIQAKANAEFHFEVTPGVQEQIQAQAATGVAPSRLFAGEEEIGEEVEMDGNPDFEGAEYE